MQLSFETSWSLPGQATRASAVQWWLLLAYKACDNRNCFAGQGIASQTPRCLLCAQVYRTMTSDQHAALERWLADLHTASSLHIRFMSCIRVVWSFAMHALHAASKAVRHLQQAQTKLPVALPLTYTRQLHCVQVVRNRSPGSRPQSSHSREPRKLASG